MIEPDGVGALQPSHAGDQIGVGGFQHQVVVIAHEAIRVNLPTGLLTSFGQRLEEVVSIHVIQENILTPIASTHHMVHRPRVLNAQLPWHGASLQRPALICQATCSPAIRTVLWVDPAMGLAHPRCPSQSATRGRAGHGRQHSARSRPGSSARPAYRMGQPITWFVFHGVHRPRGYWMDWLGAGWLMAACKRILALLEVPR